ncbi:hypothetical protein AVEN_255626-1 [Araneus ventricosus]|uniref:Uncharacterized protein n=1 Tax=Araneus ventricosus TaxID=182803 RepID=A0A4Y2W2F2_ARAVE|nr:hypothetical protein AVEN_255626-1 [Araneus ventricosus]
MDPGCLHLPAFARMERNLHSSQLAVHIWPILRPSVEISFSSWLFTFGDICARYENESFALGCSHLAALPALREFSIALSTALFTLRGNGKILSLLRDGLFDFGDI